MDPKSGGSSLPVDLVRTVGIVLVVLLHAASEPHAVVDVMSQEEIARWVASDFYNSLARPCVPLFLMLAGALLLQPGKVDERLMVFFKKRWSRIGLPFIFWGIAYFAWRFFVNGEALTASSVLQGVLEGPYIHFWFLYLLTGLYLVTPLLRVVVAYSRRKLLRYFLLIWFVGTSLVRFLSLLGPYTLNADVFLLAGWLGYFVLGIYLTKVRVQPSILFASLIFSYLWTMIGTYLVVGSLGERFSQFFFDSFSFNVIIASVSLFMILTSVKPQTLSCRFPLLSQLVRKISQNSLPIYLFHLMVMETLQKGYLGFRINLLTMNPFVEIPLVTAATLFISLVLMVLVKKLPGVDRLIG